MRGTQRQSGSRQDEKGAKTQRRSLSMTSKQNTYPRNDTKSYSWCFVFSWIVRFGFRPLILNVIG
jgi:hypothetical protein